MSRSVAVTGVGLVSCLGHDYEAVMDRLRRGESGVRAVPEWAQYGIKSQVAGRVEGVDEKAAEVGVPKKIRPGMSDAALYCSISALDAVRDSGLDPEEVSGRRTACIVGSGTGSVKSVYRAAELT